jgi:hypothetical protein
MIASVALAAVFAEERYDIMGEIDWFGGIYTSATEEQGNCSDMMTG